MLMEKIEPQLVRPPVTVRGTSAASRMIERALRFGRHRSSLRNQAQLASTEMARSLLRRASILEANRANFAWRRRRFVSKQRLFSACGDNRAQTLWAFATSQ